MQIIQKDKNEGSTTSGFGLISDERCEICGTRKIMNMDYDSMFCPKCNKWSKSKCDDSKCDYCKSRPEKPL